MSPTRRSTRSGGAPAAAASPTKSSPKKQEITKKQESPKKAAAVQKAPENNPKKAATPKVPESSSPKKAPAAQKAPESSPKKAPAKATETKKSAEPPTRKSTRTPVKKEPLDAEEPYKTPVRPKLETTPAEPSPPSSPKPDATPSPKKPEVAKKHKASEEEPPKSLENVAVEPVGKKPRLAPEEPSPVPVVPARQPAAIAKQYSEVEDKDLTENNCGRCINCNRRPCQECSHCKRSDYENCIDKYCMNQREGRDQRLAMKELYMEMMKQKSQVSAAEHQRKQKIVSLTQPEDEKKLPPVKVFDSQTTRSSEPGSTGSKTEVISDSENLVFIVEDGSQFDNDDESGAMTIEQRVDKIMSTIRKTKRDQDEDVVVESEVAKYEVLDGNKKPNRAGYVYGSSRTAKKVRRCGECEGCMRDDCGKCEICKDKPRFGGLGRLKKACIYRKCSVVSRKSKR